MKYEKGTFLIIPSKDHLKGKPSEMQAIYMWLCNYIDDSGSCFPSRNRLAKEAGCSLGTVDKYLQQLVDDGIILKEPRIVTNSKQRLSNKYTILLPENPQAINLPYPEREVAKTSIKNKPYIKKGATLEHVVEEGGSKSDRVTQSIYNSNNLTLTSDESDIEILDLPNQEVIQPIGELPLKFGKNYIDRIFYVYSVLWKSKFNTSYSVPNFKKFGAMVKKLTKGSDTSEYQLTALLLTHFNWYGATGDDRKSYLFLSSNGFPLELIPNKMNIYIAYLTNVKGIEYNDPVSVKNYVVKNLKPLL